MEIPAFSTLSDLTDWLEAGGHKVNNAASFVNTETGTGRRYLVSGCSCHGRIFWVYAGEKGKGAVRFA